MKHLAKILIGVYALAGLITIYILVPAVAADPLRSNNYVFQETSLGGTGLLSSQSANYQAAGSGAILSLSNAASSTYQFESGNLTTNDPALAFAITSYNVNFGDFSAATTATGTATFEVIDYTSYGYVVQIAGNPPSKGSHTISAMSSTGPSQAGVEQFGINVVANTSPTSLGANPDHGQFGFGSAATNYDTPNNYRFVSGETIASAPKSSGKTIYTISYIVNVNSLTPGGQYSSNQILICSGTY